MTSTWSGLRLIIGPATVKVFEVVDLLHTAATNDIFVEKISTVHIYITAEEAHLAHFDCRMHNHPTIACEKDEGKMPRACLFVEHQQAAQDGKASAARPLLLFRHRVRRAAGHPGRCSRF